MCLFQCVNKYTNGRTAFLDGYPFPDISPIGITDDVVFALLSNLKVHKASGPDGIPASLLKNLFGSSLDNDFQSISLSIRHPFTMENSKYCSNIQEG